MCKGEMSPVSGFVLRRRKRCGFKQPAVTAQSGGFQLHAADKRSVNMITCEQIRNNPEINTYIQKADESLNVIGYTEHSLSLIHI